jgi:hypothetical protein
MKKQLHNKFSRLIFSLVLLGTLLAVSGCGGGGGEETSTASPSGGGSSDGSMANYTSPSSYLTAVISISVSDGKGGVAYGGYELQVVCCGAAKKNLEWDTEIAAVPVVSTMAPTGENHLPVIDSVTSEWRLVERGKSSLIKIFAHDPDGDKLTYTWEVDRGTIKPVK